MQKSNEGTVAKIPSIKLAGHPSYYPVEIESAVTVPPIVRYAVALERIKQRVALSTRPILHAVGFLFSSRRQDACRDALHCRRV
jgi:hypothetical protein